MRGNLTSQSGFFGLRVGSAFLLCSGSALLAMLTFAAKPSGVTLSINDVTLAEDTCQSTSFVFTVTLSHLGKQPVTVNYATQDGAAVANKDYVPVSGFLSFHHGMRPNGPHGSYLMTITVPLGNYVVSSGANDGRTFTVTLSGATNATIIKPQGVGTLTNAALSCTPAQNGVCFVNFCGGQTTCQSVNRSATAVSWCTLAGTNGPPDPDFGVCNGAGLWRDNDGDGFSDAAETQGYIDVNANGVYDAGTDVLLSGADPQQPDLYLHYDYFYADDHTHNPPPEAIQWMVDAFAAHGINLHIDPQHNAINESTGKVVTLANPPDPFCAGPNAVSMHQLRQTYLPPNFKLAYHYMVFSHWNTCDSAQDCNRCAADPECGGGSPPAFGTYGTSEIFGDDAIVSFGTFTDAGVPIPPEAVSGVAMHEFGHNFGLFHGGGDCDNYKPNYLSVMSYNFYTTGIPVGAAPGDNFPQSCVTDADCPALAHCAGSDSVRPNTCFRIDYSGVQLANLNENGGLDETIGLSGSPTSTDISIFTTTGIDQILVPTNGTPIDWNENGIFETNVTKDINGDGATTLLTGFDDWANLNFDFQCSPNFDND